MAWSALPSPLRVVCKGEHVVEHSQGTRTSEKMIRRPLVLTGGPAVGKSSTGKAVATARPRAAFIDVDDVRQLIVAGGEPPWRGEQGLAQQKLGVLNACCMARHLTAAGFDVVIADVLTPRTALVYRQKLPRCLIVHLVVPLAEALRRAARRRVWLTDDEFRALHRDDVAAPPTSDNRLDVASMSLEDQISTVERLWSGA
jgi:hypothetical protein